MLQVWAGRAGIRGAAAPSGLRVEGASPLVCSPQSGKRGQGLLLCCLLVSNFSDFWLRFTGDLSEFLTHRSK
jgi:hypothetical protein